MKSFFVFTIFLCCYTNSFCQSLTIEYAKIKDYSPDKNHIKQICLGYDSIYKSISYVGKKEDVVMKDALNQVKKKLQELNSQLLLMQKDSITLYLKSIVSRIQKNNPSIQNRKFNIFVYRTIEPNAANYGNGVILFNLDLIASLSTEDDLAFILCHEIGHDMREHVVNGVRKNFEIQASKDLKQEYAKIRKQNYNRYKSFEIFAAKYLNQLTIQSREHEIQADSIGLSLFYNAGYFVPQAYKTIQRLDSADLGYYTSKLDYSKFFDFPDHPFKQSLLLPEEAEETIDGGNMVKLPDSLKTHPDCKIRVQKVQNIKFDNATALSSKPSKVFILSQFEMLSIYREEFELSRGLYNSLQLSAKYPDNTYLKCCVADFLYEIYYSKIDHYFSLAVDFPDKRYSEGYVELLHFLGNINSNGLKVILEQYFKKNFSTTLKDPYSGYILMLLKNNGKSKEEKFLSLKEYHDFFGENEYYVKLKSKFDLNK